MDGRANGEAVREGVEAAKPEETQPLFEIIVPGIVAGLAHPAYHFKIWGDGRIEGFEKLGDRAGAAVVVNRLPTMLFGQIVMPLRDFVEDLAGSVAELGPIDMPGDLGL